LARKQRVDRQFNSRLDDLERRMMLLKISYDKYFSGIELIEPMRERDDIKRTVRDLMQVAVTNTVQLHRFRTLKARSVSLDQYIQRNLVMIERGTHPKMRFRANLADQRRREGAALGRRRQASPEETRAREDAAYDTVIKTFIDARKKAGAKGEVSMDAVREKLKKQVREVKSRYRVKSVVFKVVSEDGKVKLKAVPKRE
jgi:hypothetical protein